MNSDDYKNSVGIEEYCKVFDCTYNVGNRDCKNNKALKAFKVKNRWRIPTTVFNELKNEHEKYNLLINKSYMVTEVVDLINKSRGHVHTLITQGDILGGFKYKEKWYVNKSEVHKWIENKNIHELKKSMTLSEISNKYNLSRTVIRNYIKDYDSGAFKDNKIWYIPLDKLYDLEKNLGNKIKLASGKYYTFSDIQKKFQVSKVNAKTIAWKYFQKNKLRSQGKVYFDKNVVDKHYNNLNELERNPSILDNFYSIKDIESIMKLTNNGVFNLLRREKNIIVKKRYNKSYIDKKSFDKYFKTHPFSYSYTLVELMSLLKLSRYQVTELINAGKFKNVIKENRVWYIPKKENQDYINEYILLNKKAGKSLTLTQLSEESGISRPSIAKSRYSGVFKNAFIHNEIWYIPNEDVNDFYQLHLSLENTLSTVDAAKILGYKNATSISALISDNKFPNAFKYKKEWKIPLKDIEEFERILDQKESKINFTNDFARAELNKFLNEINYNSHIENTIDFYVKYVNMFLVTTTSNEINKRYQFNIYMNFLRKIHREIHTELYLLNEKELDLLFGVKTVFTSPELKVLSKFYKFCCSEKGIENNFELKQVNSSQNERRTKDDDIYSPEEFNKIYLHVTNTELHIKSAIEHDFIANIWAYVILHCTTFIRGNDLLSESLQIDLGDLNIHNLNWFNHNRLNESQIELVIKQLYYYYKNRKTSKTGELLTFLVEDSLREPLAYAMIISELHRKSNEKEYFFYTFYSRSMNTRSISGKASHQQFFRNYNDFKNFEFKTLKMNRSIGTYLFNSITDGPSTKSDLALFLTQKSRSHKSGDTTSLYVQTTNKDGPINEVSYNVSKRGAFGWLYTGLLNLLVNETDLTEKNKNEIVKTIRESISPIQLERHAEFGVNHINKNINIVLQKDKEKILGNIRKKQQNIVNHLIEYNTENLKDIMYKLSKGLMPSKIDHAQCLVSNNCAYPNQKNCLQCEFVIPEKMVLIQLNSELNYIIKRIAKESNLLLLRKYSSILFKLLIILKESRLTNKDEIVNSYISLENLRQKLNNVSEKLQLQEME